MNLRQVTKFTIFFLASAALLSACNSNDNEYTIEDTSPDAQIRSFSISSIPMTPIDTIIYPSLATAKFSIISDGIYRVFNTDSLPQFTDIRTLKVNITYSSTPSGVQLVYKDRNDVDSLPEAAWNGADSIKFIYNEKYGYFPKLNVIAPNGIERRYTVEFNIHKTDPDSIKWSSASNFSLLKKGENKTIISQDSTTFYSLTNEATGVYLYTSSISVNSPKWEKLQKTDLPLNTLVKSFCIVDNSFVVIDGDGNIHTTPTNSPVTWTSHNQNKIIGLLGTLTNLEDKTKNDILLLHSKSDGEIVFAKTELSNLDKLTELNITAKSENSIPTDFPVNNFSSLPSKGLSTDEYLMITGGINSDNSKSIKTWIIKNVAAGEINISYGQKDVASKYKNGVVTFIYNNSMYMLANDSILHISNSFGDKWSKANIKQHLAPEMIKDGRQMPSVIVDKEDYVWIFGGRNASSGYLTDVWRGRLNKLAYTHK